MRRWLFLLAAPLAASTLTGHRHNGSRIDLQLDDGVAAVEFWSDSTFRFTRRWNGAIGLRDKSPGETAVELSETATHLRLATKYLIVSIEKQGLRLRATGADGSELAADAATVERKGGGVVWDRAAAPGARLYGLGARTGPLDFRGTRVDAMKPFLISSTGYGEYHVAPGKYAFDARSAGSYRIESDAGMVDYYIFFGPHTKEIFEQYLLVTGPIDRLSPSRFRALARKEAPGATMFPERPGDSLGDFIQRLVNGSMSGMILPGWAPIASSPRAMQLGAVLPVLIAPSTPAWRSKLSAFWMTYAEEARDRGFPFLRSMPMQYPRDPEAGKYGDQFMLGDEFLVAPISGESNRRSVYLPMGNWTNLATDEMHRGRQVIQVESDDLPVFSRNGGLFPLGQDPTELHYFPKLGGEFFLYEADLADYSQVHASPAGASFRFEIESKKDRDYQWVIHHFERPRTVTVRDQPLIPATAEGALHPGAWFYDAGKKRLHVRVLAEKGDHHIVTVSF